MTKITSWKVASSFFGALLISIIQGVILDLYIRKYKKNLFYYAIVCDILFIFSISILWYFAKKWMLPYLFNKKPYFALFFYWDVSFWFFYTLFLIIRISIVFKYIVYKLRANQYFGTILLKLTIALSTIVFMLLILKDLNSKNHEYNGKIKSILHSVPFNLFDSVDILEILFIEETHIILPFSYHNALIILGCINFVLPIYSLLYLNLYIRKNKFGFNPKCLNTIDLLHKMCNLFLLNIPYLVLRIFLWTTLDTNVTTYIIKNVLYIIVDFFTIISLLKKIFWQKSLKTVNGHHEMMKLNNNAENLNH